MTFAPSEAAYAEATLRVIITQVPRKSAGALPILGEADTVDLEAFACTLRGRGHLARLDIRDGTVAFPRAIYLGERVSGNPITITNPTQSTVAWAFNDAQRITIDGSLVQRADQADLIWAPNGGLLAPGASVASRPTATGMNVGSYDVSCGIDIADEKSGETHEAARVAVVRANESVCSTDCMDGSSSYLFAVCFSLVCFSMDTSSAQGLFFAISFSFTFAAISSATTAAATQRRRRRRLPIACPFVWKKPYGIIALQRY